MASVNSDLSNFLKIVNVDFNNITINGNSALEMQPEIPDVPGYTYLIPLGGRSFGNVGLLFQVGHFWIYNTRDVETTYDTVRFVLLYVKNIG